MFPWSLHNFSICLLCWRKDLLDLALSQTPVSFLLSSLLIFQGEGLVTLSPQMCKNLIINPEFKTLPKHQNTHGVLPDCVWEQKRRFKETWLVIKRYSVRPQLDSARNERIMELNFMMSVIHLEFPNISSSRPKQHNVYCSRFVGLHFDRLADIFFAIINWYKGHPVEERTNLFR